MGVAHAAPFLFNRFTFISMNKTKIILAGGSGFLGTLLTNHFLKQGNEVIILTRGTAQPADGVQYVNWDGKHQGEWTKHLEGADLVVNLNGKSVDCRYTTKNKQLIYATRLDATVALGKAITNCKQPPACWINASSATIYRYSIDQTMDEYTGEIGEGFSVDVCQQWEQSFNKFELPKTRKVIMRIGIVLGKEGGAVKPLKMLTRLGLGGKQGSGQQYMSLLHQTDFVNAVDFLFKNVAAKGVYNLVSPNPITNKDFMHFLRKSLSIPFGIPLPEYLLKLGAYLINTETELIIKSRRVIPTRLSEEGFTFTFPLIEEALTDLKN
jgi:uncharacterized protein (TIGR01777 family)